MTQIAVTPELLVGTKTAETHLTQRQRLALRWQLLKARVKEYLLFDSVIFGIAAGWLGLLTARLLSAAGRTKQSFALLCRLHRGNFSSAANRRAERLVREAAASAAQGSDHPVLKLYEAHVAQLQPNALSRKFADDPSQLLGSLAIVLKSPSADEKGVLLLQYSFSFPLFAKLFDVPRIAEKYYLVLEPDWSGYCDPNILAYSRYPFPVFVQAVEPRDAQLLEATCPNFVTVPTGNNWWLDHRLFAPATDVEKEFDVVMNAGWAVYKRHARFFAALRTLKRTGQSLRTLLVGYPMGKSRAEILDLARYFGIANQIEICESVPYEQMGTLVSRAKVGVLWSRKEGSNRAIIEMMLAGVPCILREGHNYGYRYAYINRQTGCFANERDLPQKLIAMVREYERYTSREWVLANMSCERATAILSETIARTAIARGETWTRGLAVKVNKLHNVEYWDPEVALQFHADYAFFKTAILSDLRPQ